MSDIPVITTILETPQQPKEEKKVVETQPIVNPQPQDEPQDTTTTIAPDPAPQTKKDPLVIDKRTGEKKLNSVSETADSITSIADLDEEEFIKEVEKHHDNTTG